MRGQHKSGTFIKTNCAVVIQSSFSQSRATEINGSKLNMSTKFNGPTPSRTNKQIHSWVSTNNAQTFLGLPNAITEINGNAVSGNSTTVLGN